MLQGLPDSSPGHSALAVESHSALQGRGEATQTPETSSWSGGSRDRTFSPPVLSSTSHDIPLASQLGSGALFIQPSPLGTTHTSSQDDCQALSSEFLMECQAPFSRGTALLPLKWGPETHDEKSQESRLPYPCDVLPITPPPSLNYIIQSTFCTAGIMPPGGVQCQQLPWKLEVTQKLMERLEG